MSVWTVRDGSSMLPYFAEYPYYLWGTVNYDSEGDCKRPTDRAWSWLALENRKTRERLSISVADGLVRLDGDSAQLAAMLTAARTGGVVVDEAGQVAALPADHLARLSLANLVQAQFLDPNLVAFDTVGWWGGWKWIGDFSTDMTGGLRVVMQSIHERRLADPAVRPFLEEWLAAPPKPFHVDGVRFAADFVERL